jgi:hypothetical protein
MDQFGKPGYPACLSCPSATVAVTQERPKSSTGAGLNSLPAIVFTGSRTAIRFTLNNEACVTFRLYSSSGRSINQISVAGVKGTNTVMWDAFGKLPSALYLIEMQVNKGDKNFARIAKMR